MWDFGKLVQHPIDVDAGQPMNGFEIDDDRDLDEEKLLAIDAPDADKLTANVIGARDETVLAVRAVAVEVDMCAGAGHSGKPLEQRRNTPQQRHDP